MVKRFAIGLIAMAVMTVSAHADVIQLVPDGTAVLSTYYINKNGTGIADGNSNDTANQLYRLNTYFLDTPFVPTASLKPASQTNDWSGGGLGNWDYAVVHFGAGAYGGDGGTVGAWDLNGMDSFVFPSGSFSSIDFFQKTERVPEPMTLLLFGVGLLGIGTLRLKRVS